MAIDLWSMFWLCVPLLVIGVLIYLAAAVKIIRPVEKALVERFGKFSRTAEPGLLLVIPGIENVVHVPTTEMRVDVAEQTVITSDNLNAVVDAIVYYRINDVVKAVYNIDNFRTAIPSLAQTTLRAVMGKMTLAEANGNRQQINASLEEELDKETQQWGVDIIRVELQRIDPPHDVQQAMNNVVKAENEKRAAVDLATAAETNADGIRRAAVKAAEGDAKSIELKALANAHAVEMAAQANAKAVELRAQADAKAIQLVNEAAQKYFKGDAQTLKKLQVAEKSLSENTKYVIPEGTDISTIITEAAGITPIPKKKSD
ncbi:Stomatin [Candidatus Bilamarchaeum dharawalense]|uniref:Stomatin n=1 Tax=Candidatus Bilamarchaeum dharawalense TaxID=2885759 RepID=A0A5E4LTT7_9ARCH|nr:Stomatin [Candidatus Bilamarchaeum dharawalense]